MWSGCGVAVRPPAKRASPASFRRTSVTSCCRGSAPTRSRSRWTSASLDFRTLESRKRFCEEEVRLNARLSPDIYLGTESIRRLNAGAYALGGSGGEVVDYAVVMRRIPARAMFETILDRGGGSVAQARELAETLAAFHLRADRNAEIAQFGSVQTVRGNWVENFRADTPVRRAASCRRRTTTGSVATSIASLHDHAGLFQRRVDGGYVRGRPRRPPRSGRRLHGYRRAHPGLHRVQRAHALRRRGGGPGVSPHGPGWPRAGGAADEVDHALPGDHPGQRPPAPAAVLLLLPGLRAGEGRCVSARRARGLRRAEGASSRERSAALPAGAGIHRAAAGTAAHRDVRRDGQRQEPPRRAARGPPGRALALRPIRSGNGWRARAPHERSGATGVGTGIYDDAGTARTYAALLAEARHSLQRGEAVVLDATFTQADQRAAVQTMAAEMKAPLDFLICEADDDVVRQRIVARRADAGAASEGTLEVYQAQRRLLASAARRARQGAATGSIPDAPWRRAFRRRCGRWGRPALQAARPSRRLWYPERTSRLSHSDLPIRVIPAPLRCATLSVTRRISVKGWPRCQKPAAQPTY